MNEAFMREAIALSIEKMGAGEGGPFGAVIAKDGKIIGRGWNRVTSANDPTAHAEVMAIRDACAALGTFDLSGCEIYASCEPCPMCLSAIYWARLDKLYFAATRADAAAAGFDDELIYREISRVARLGLQAAGKPWTRAQRESPREGGATTGGSGKNRSLPAEQGMQTEAQKAFATWKENADRMEY